MRSRRRESSEPTPTPDFWLLINLLMKIDTEDLIQIIQRLKRKHSKIVSALDIKINQQPEHAEKLSQEKIKRTKEAHIYNKAIDKVINEIKSINRITAHEK